MNHAEKFIEQLDTVPWFANLGKLSPRDREVFRIYHWDTWPGPEDPGTAIQNDFLMQRHDKLFESGKRIPDLINAWQVIQERVMNLTKANVGYDDARDVWFGPNAAVLQAAFTAALVGCTIHREGGLDENHDPTMQWTLSNEWSWYKAGHWPCMYYWPWSVDVDVAGRTGGAKRLVIY